MTIYTDKEAHEIAVTAARKALETFTATHPQPSTVSIAQAADMLKVSARTIARLNLPRIGGRIPYSAIVERLASK